MLKSKLKDYEIEQLTSMRVKVTFKDHLEANKLTTLAMTDKEYDVSIPQMYVFSVSIIKGVPTEISDEEIIDNMESSLEIHNVERLTKWENESKTRSSTENIVIKFRAITIPSTVNIYNIKLRVDYYIPPPLFAITV